MPSAKVRKTSHITAPFTYFKRAGGMIRSKQDRIDGTNGTPVMTWEQLREMAADGNPVSVRICSEQHQSEP